MSWIQVTINTTDKNAEQVEKLLGDLGALSVTFQDAFNTPVFETFPGETRLWNHTDVIGLFLPSIDLSQLKHTLLHSPYFLSTMTYKIAPLEEKNWAREWMNNFNPIQCGQRLWICPSWREIPDTTAVNVILDPGLAFGTGNHPTTVLCLNWLDALNLQGKTVIDYGCGSGILAIAAVKLGASKAIAIDIDPQALETCLENGKRNNVCDQLTVCFPDDLTEDTKADIVVANIVAGCLKELAEIISQRVKPGGHLALSGILPSQAEAVCLAYCADFILDDIATQEEWCRITGVKKQ